MEVRLLYLALCMHAVRVVLSEILSIFFVRRSCTTTRYILGVQINDKYLRPAVPALAQHENSPENPLIV